MTVLAAIVFGVGAGDLVNGLTGEPRRRRLVGAVGIGSAATLGAALILGHTATESVAIGVLGTVLVIGWQVVRLVGTRAPWALSYLGSGFTIAVVFSSRWQVDGDSVWSRFWVDLQSSALSDIAPNDAALGLAAAVALTATSNSVVRLILALDEVDIDDGPEQEVKGGRVIGPIERLLLFGVVIAGSPTTAGLVVAAKSLLRFPELSEKSRIHDTTEYVVIGSLASWALALLAAVFVV